MVLWIAACAHRPPPAPAPAAPEPSAEARAFYLRAEVASLTGDAVEAERAAAWVPRLDPLDVWASVRASDLARRGGDPDRARFEATRALTVDPELPEAHRVAGLAALAAGDTATALAHLERASGLPGVDAARVRALRDSGGDALGALRAWSPASASETLERSAVALELGEVDLALSDALSVLDHPAFGPDGLRAAVATCRLAEVDAALAGHRRADPRWVEAIAGLEAARATCAERP